MKIARTSISKAVEAVMIPGVKRATVFQSSSTVIKATRKYKGRKNEKSTTLILTMGVPNAREKEFIKNCHRAGVPFPVKCVKLDWYKKNTKKGN